MNTIINKTKSKIRVKRNTLRTDSAHAEVELWGTIPNTLGIKLINFGPSPKGGVFLSQATDPLSPTEVLTDEDFSILIWSLQIDANDEIQLSKEDADKVYEQVVRSKKMFLTVTGLTLS